MTASAAAAWPSSGRVSRKRVSLAGDLGGNLVELRSVFVGRQHADRNIAVRGSKPDLGGAAVLGPVLYALDLDRVELAGGDLQALATDHREGIPRDAPPGATPVKMSVADGDAPGGAKAKASRKDSRSCALGGSG